MKLSKIFSALVCVAVVATMFLAVAVSADTGTTGTAQQEVSPLYQVLSHPLRSPRGSVLFLHHASAEEAAARNPADA